MEHHYRSGRGQDDRRITQENVLEQYGQWGANRPDVDTLRQVIETTRQRLSRPVMRITHAGALLDLATHPSEALSTQERTNMVDQAAERLQPLDEPSPRSLNRKDVNHWLDGSIYLAYIPHFAKAAQGTQPDLADEYTMREHMHMLGWQALDVLAAYREDWQGHHHPNRLKRKQLVIGAHILSARFNLQNKGRQIFSWPSFPREWRAHDHAGNEVSWDITFARTNFAHYADFYPVRLSGQPVDPEQVTDTVLHISGASLGVDSPAEIISGSLTENNGDYSQDLREIVSARMDTVQQRFFEQLGWRFPE
jgi:hypothetical protein